MSLTKEEWKMGLTEESKRGRCLVAASLALMCLATEAVLALSDWEVDELIAMRSRGASVAEVAARFSLSERTVRRYLRRHAGGEGGGSHAGA